MTTAESILVWAKNCAVCNSTPQVVHHTNRTWQIKCNNCDIATNQKLDAFSTLASWNEAMKK